MKSKRLCRVCHEPATHVEIESKPVASIKLDGTVIRDMQDEHVYYCGKHTGIWRAVP